MEVLKKKGNAKHEPEWMKVGNDSVKVAQIYATRNYSRFTFLEGNREVNHAKKIMSSLRQIGILFQPVLVNEKFQIIEGQGRYVAMKTLKMPILYVIQPGIGIEVVGTLNSVATKWKIRDYVHRYAAGEDSDNPGARYLECLAKEFPRYSHKLIYGVATNSGLSMNGGGSANFKKGCMPMTEEQYCKAREVLAYLDKFDFVYNSVEGRVECLQSALAFFYLHEKVDKDHLFKQMQRRYTTIPPIANARQSIDEIQTIYNYNPRGVKPVYIKSDFEEKMAVRKSKKPHEV